MEASTTRAAVVKPFGNRIAVVDPPAEDQTPSGLLLPAGAEEIATGIVVSNPACEDSYSEFMSEMNGHEIKRLRPGCKVYYHKGHSVEIKGVRVIGAECVLAYEEA